MTANEITSTNLFQALVIQMALQAAARENYRALVKTGSRGDSDLWNSNLEILRARLLIQKTRTADLVAVVKTTYSEQMAGFVIQHAEFESTWGDLKSFLSTRPQLGA